MKRFLLCVTIFAVATSIEAMAQTPKSPDGFPLPSGAIHRFGNRQLRSPDSIVAAAASPDGKMLATLGTSGVVVWDVNSLNAKHFITAAYFGGYGFGDRSSNLAFLPDSKSLLVTVRPTDRTSISVNEQVEMAQIWDIETGKKKFGLKGGWGFAFASWLAAEGKEIALLAGYRESATIKYFDAKDGKELRSIKFPLMNRGAWVAPNGTFVAIPNDNGESLRIMDTKTGEELHAISSSRLIQVAISPDAKRLIYHDDGGKVHVYDLEAKKELFTFAHPAEKQRGPMLFSKDQNTLYFGGQYGQLFRWDLKNNKPLPDIGKHSSWTLTTIALSPDESVLYSMGADKLVRRWDLKTGQQLPLPEGYITQTAIVPTVDGKNLIVSDHAGAIDYWDLASGKHVKQLQPGKTGGIDCVATSPDGRWLAGGRTVQDVQLWDLPAGKLEKTIPLVEKPDEKGGDHVKRVFFSPDSKVLFTGSAKTGITAWEVPGGKKLWNVPDSGQLAACDPSGRQLAVGGGFINEPIRWTLLDAATGQVIRRVEVTGDGNPEEQGNRYIPYVCDVIFSHDGSRVLTAHYDGIVRIWDPETGKLLGKLVGSSQGWMGIALSPDSRLLGVGRADKKISIWELASGREVLKLESHDSAVREVAFTRDGHGIIGNADLAPILWSLDPKDSQASSLTPDEQWETLAMDGSVRPYKLVWALSHDPKGAVKLFNERIKPAELKMEKAQFDKWLAGLDSPQFRVREVAEKSLLDAGPKIPVAWIRQTLTMPLSDEVRARLERVLVQREKPNPAEWRLGRAVQALELAGTPEARALLKRWAEAAGSNLALEARASLERLGK